MTRENIHVVLAFLVGLCVGVVVCIILSRWPPGGLTRQQMLHNVCPSSGPHHTHWCAGRPI